MFKKIGVIICESSSSYQTKLLQGINQRAHQLGYDVLVFTTFVKLCFHENYEYGEKNIFNLIQFDKLNGLIVAGDTLQVRNLKETLFPRLQTECKCPIVFVDYDNDMGYDNITTDDTIAFEEIVDHLIEKHQCRNILFYSGPYSVSSTRVRYTGYQNALKKHNIALDSDFVSFDGNFWIESGEAVAREIIEGRRKRPDAIAFCGDYMAIAAQQTFQEAGWRIPEDIIITGFDAQDDSLRCVPPITSYTPAVDIAGENAVIALDAKIKGITSPEWVPSKGHFEIGGSCGCQEDFNYTKRIYYHNETSFDYQKFLHSSMMEDMAEAESFPSLLCKIDFFLYLLTGWQEFHLCLCDKWLNYDIFYGEDSYLTDGYSEKMVQYIKSRAGNNRIVQESFDTSLMLPALYEDKQEPFTYYFTPLHMNRKCFGYAVLSYGSSNKVFDINYVNWTKHICNALEYFRIRSKIARVADFDVLTGAYTRSGIQRNIDLLLSKIAYDNHKFMVLSADLNGLKYINDTFGHSAGDQAISEFAEILLSITDCSELCGRIGGDEFIILGCDDYPDSKIEDICRQINEKIDLVNASGRLNFTLSSSLGGIIAPISKASDIDALYQEADVQMYRMKRKFHQEA